MWQKTRFFNFFCRAIPATSMLQLVAWDKASCGVVLGGVLSRRGAVHVSAVPHANRLCCGRDWFSIAVVEASVFFCYHSVNCVGF